MAKDSPITIARFWTKVRAPSDFQCWTWEGKRKHGYGMFGNVPAHRWAYEFFNAAICEGDLILHSCDNRACVNPAHLRPGSHHANVQDAVARGRYSPKAKLTEDQVRYIRRNPDNLTVKKIAANLGLAESTVSYVRSGITWRHVA